MSNRNKKGQFERGWNKELLTMHIGKELTKNRIEIEDILGDTMRDCGNLEYRNNETFRLNEMYCEDFCSYYKLCQEVVFLK